MMAKDSPQSPLHPYYPIDARIYGYVANDSSVLSLLTATGTGCVAVLGTVFMLVSYTQPTLSKADRLAILWFFLCMILPR